MNIISLVADIAGIAGLAAAIYGVSLISIPASFIIGGLAVMGLAFLLSPDRLR